MHELICLVHTGAALADPAALVSQIDAADWRADGSFWVRWVDGEEVDVPVL
jgi:hypothetical protein